MNVSDSACNTCAAGLIQAVHTRLCADITLSLKAVESCLIP